MNLFPSFSRTNGLKYRFKPIYLFVIKRSESVTKYCYKFSKNGKINVDMLYIEISKYLSLVNYYSLIAIISSLISTHSFISISLSPIFPDFVLDYHS